jgi:cellobiose-specific phosphotransferase system component IIC
MNSTIGVPRVVPTPGDNVCDYWIPGKVSSIIEHVHALPWTVPSPLGEFMLADYVVP